MYTAENYLWGLVAYALGCLLILPGFWKATRLLIPWAPPRAIVRLLLAAVILTPIKAYEDMMFIAPAWVVATFEVFRPTTVEGPFRALMPILAVFFGLVLLYILFVLGRFFIRSDSGEPPQREAGG